MFGQKNAYTTSFRLNQKGGFFGLFSNSCDTNNNQNFLSSIKNNDVVFATSMLKNKMVTDICTRDSNKNTVLHLLTINSDKTLTQTQKSFLSKLRKCKQSDKLVDMKNSEGDTALHLCAKLGKDDLGSILINFFGANTSIQNKKGFKVNYTASPNDDKLVDMLSPTNEKSDAVIITAIDDDNDPDSEKTDMLISKVKRMFSANGQSGGKRRTITGIRTVELMSRQYDPDASKVRDQVLDKIKEITNADETEAKDIRAYLWKENKHNVKGTNKDKWVAMLADIQNKNKSYFDSIKDKVVETTDAIQKHLKEKKEKFGDRKDNKSSSRPPRDYKKKVLKNQSDVNLDTTTDSSEKPAKKSAKKSSKKSKGKSDTESTDN